MKKSILCILTIFVLGFVLAATACKGKDESVESPNDSSSYDSSEISLVVKEKEKTLYVGETYKIEATGDGAISFESSDELIAVVSSDGIVTAVADGTAFLTVSDEKSSVTCRINVIKSSEYIRLGATETGVVKGGETSIKAEIIKNGEVFDGEISFTADDALKIKRNGNEIIVSSDKIGYYVVTARYENLSAEISVKVVNENAKFLATPKPKVENCKTLKWDAVANADGYKVMINGGDWKNVSGTSFAADDLTAGLKSGEKVVFSVRAVAKNDFDFLDGLPERLVFGHDYAEEVLEPYTCVIEGKVKYTCRTCGKTYEEDGVLAPHHIVDGACSNCGKIITEKVMYLYDDKNECYYVAGADAGFDAEEVYILAKYNDGKNGEHPVKYFGCGAFQSNEIIRKVIVPESMTEFEDAREEFNIISVNGKKVSSPLRGLTFDACINLEFVSVAGMHYFPAVDKSELPYHHDNFRDCNKLTQIIVGDGFYNQGRTFMNWQNTPKDFEPVTDIYVKGTKVDTIATDSYPIGTESGANNNLLTGDVFYYSQNSTKCFTWYYDAQGNFVSNGKHEYKNGVCKKCKSRDDYGVRYAYDSKNSCYYVGDNKSINKTELEILAEFDDGTNGVHPVSYVRNGAFKTNQKLKKVILPASVTALDGSVFENCTSLEFVSMTGIGDMTFKNIERVYGKVTTNNNFIKCFALKKVVVGKKFNLYADSADAQQFIGGGENLFEPCVDIYVDATESESNVKCAPSAKNNLLTGIVYYKGNLTVCKRWNLNKNGDMVTTAQDHTFKNGVCKTCGVYETDGTNYVYDSANEVYYVAGYSGSGTEVNVLEKYCDGENGVHSVTYVRNGAFQNNNVITSVVLPKSVTRLDGSVFQGCGELKFVSMTGITDMAFINLSNKGIYKGESGVVSNNNFLGCEKLTKVLVNKNFNLYADSATAQQFYTASAAACVDIYVDGTKAESNVNCAPNAQNKLLTGKVYYYSANKADNCWRYVDGKVEKW